MADAHRIIYSGPGATSAKRTRSTTVSELNAANAQGREGRQWEFAEYHHGLTHAPMGTHFQAWSAAAGVLAHQAVWHNEIPWPLSLL